MGAGKELKAVVAQPGRPLYLAVKDAVREAIDAGVFRPGEQMPSTKDLSEQLAVSLVTAHRALQELVATGVLQRSQGKGTFVHQRVHEQQRASTCRIGLVFHADASLADYYHCQIMEGVRQGARKRSVDLVLLRYGEDLRNECNGFLFINPLPHELEETVRRINRRQPVLSIGAPSHLRQVCWIDVDNVGLARQAVDHLAALGHRRIGCVGGSEQNSNNLDRYTGFQQACVEHGLSTRPEDVLKGSCWRLQEGEREKLLRMLGAPDRPTAVFAAGYYFALDLYGAAATAGLRIPEDLSVLGVDDPPSAEHLSPPLTTLRQPLVQLGNEAVTMLCDRVLNGGSESNRTLEAELIVRRSAGPVAAN